MAGLVSMGENVWQMQTKSEAKATKTKRPKKPEVTPLPTTSKDTSDKDQQLQGILKLTNVFQTKAKVEQIEPVTDVTIPEQKPISEEDETLPPKEEETLILTTKEKVDGIKVAPTLKLSLINLLDDNAEILKLLQKMDTWLSPNIKRVLEIVDKVSIEDLITYQQFFCVMIDLDSPFGILELHALVIQLSTQKPGLISKEDIKKGVHPKESMACDICGFGKAKPIETFAVPLKQMLVDSERKASLLIIQSAKDKQFTQLLSQPDKDDTQKYDDVPKQPHLKSAFANMGKNIRQNSKPKIATFLENQPKNVLPSKKPSSHSNENVALLPPRRIHAFKSMRNLMHAQTRMLVFSDGNSKPTELRSENNEQRPLQTANNRMKKKISESGGNTKENLPIKPWLMKSKSREDRSKSMRMHKRNISGSQLKRSTDMLTNLKHQKSGFSKVLSEKLKVDTSKHVKNIFSRAAGISKVNKVPRFTNVYNTLKHSAKKEVETVLPESNFDFIKVQSYTDDEKPTKPIIREMFVLVQLRAIVYDEIPSCPLHFSILVNNDTTISYLGHHIKQFCDINCEEVYISPNRLRFQQSLLPNSFTLKQCGYRGYCKTHPQKITLYYDFDIPFKPGFIANLNM